MAINWSAPRMQSCVSLQVVSEKALQKSGERVPFPINPVCKGENSETPSAPNATDERRVLGEFAHKLSASKTRPRRSTLLLRSTLANV